MGGAAINCHPVRCTASKLIRAHLAEFAIVAGVGRNGIEALLALIAKGIQMKAPFDSSQPTIDELMAAALGLRHMSLESIAAISHDAFTGRPGVVA